MKKIALTLVALSGLALFAPEVSVAEAAPPGRPGHGRTFGPSFHDSRHDGFRGPRHRRFRHRRLPRGYYAPYYDGFYGGYPYSGLSIQGRHFSLWIVR
jgi:hypothetical protein